MMNANIDQELVITFLRIREYKKQTGNISAPFEKLFQLVVFQREQHSLREILVKLFEYEENNEFIHIALISCINKIIKYTCMEEHDTQIEGTIEQKWMSSEALIEIIQKMSRVSVNDSTFDIYFPKKLQLIRTILELPLRYISSEVIDQAWQFFQDSEQISSIELKEQARDSTFFSMVSFINRIISNHSEGYERIDQVIEILRTKIKKCYEQYTQAASSVQQVAKAQENLKALELPLNLLIFAVQCLKKNDLLQNHTKLIQRDFLFMISKLSRLESVGLYSKILQAFELVFDIYKSGLIEDTIHTRFLFGQIVYLKLKQCLKRKEEKEVTAEFLCLMTFLHKFLGDRSNLFYIFSKNDFLFQNQPILLEILKIVIELSRSRQEKDDLSYIQACSSNLLMQIMNLPEQTQKEDSQQVLEYFRLYSQCKIKWEDLSTTFNESSKKFLNKIAGFKQVQDFKNLDETSIEQIVKFLRVFHDVNQKHMLEVLGGQEKFHARCLQKYIGLLNFSKVSILEATRIVFSTFLMTGESQQVLRILEAFSLSYYENNKSLFLSSDSTYTYIAALMMLHSDLHNLNNEKKMLPEQFVKQVSGVNEKTDLPKDFVLDCYYNIQQDEIKECRNFHTSLDTTQIIWNYLESDNEFNTDTNKLSFMEPQLEEIDNDPKIKLLVAEKAVTDMILSTLLNNMDAVIATFFELDERNVQIFVDSLVSLTSRDPDPERLSTIFQSFFEKSKVDNIAESDEKSIQYLHLCFVIASSSLSLLNKDLAVKLLVKTTKLRSAFIKDSVAIRCNSIVKKIRESNDFYNQNKHNNRSFLDIFSKFLEQEEQSDDEKEEKVIVALSQKIPSELMACFSKRFQSDDFTRRILNSTQIMEDKEYEEFINSILHEFSDFNIQKISQSTHTFSHLIDLCIEIMKTNSDRVEKVWEKICILLKLGFSREKLDKTDPLLLQIDSEELKNLIFTLNEFSVFKKKKKTFMHSFSKFCLLELCISHMHLCDKFNSFDDCLQEGLNYLDDCSLLLIEEFNRQLNIFIISNKLHDCRSSSYLQVLKILAKIQEVLNGKNLEKEEVVANCLFLKDSLGNFILSLTEIKDDTEYATSLEKTMRFFEGFVKSKVFKILEAESWVVQTVQVLLSSQEQRVTHMKSHEREMNIAIVLALFNSISCMREWNETSTEILLSAIHKGVLQLKNKWVGDELLKLIYDRIRLCQNKVLVYKSELLIGTYVTILEKLYLGWINKERFSESFLISFIMNLAEMFKFAEENQLKGICEVIRKSLENIVKLFLAEEIFSIQAQAFEKITKICQKYQIKIESIQLNSSKNQKTEEPQAENTSSTKSLPNEDISTLEKGRDSMVEEILESEKQVVQDQQAQIPQEQNSTLELKQGDSAEKIIKLDENEVVDHSQINQIENQEQQHSN